MKIFILITAIIELLAGFLLFFAVDRIPQLAGLADGNHALLTLYGAAAIALGLFALNVWRHYSNEALVSAFLSTFVIFHVGVAIAARGAFAAGALPDMNTSYLHGIMALITAYFWVRNQG